MFDLNQSTGFARMLIVSAAVVIVLWGMKAASGLIAPFLMAIFVAIICAPALFWLQRRRVPDWLALIIVLGVIGLIGALVIGWVSDSLAQISQILPSYKAKLIIMYADFSQWLATRNLHLPEINMLNVLSPDRLMKMFNHLLNGLSGVIGNALIVFLAVLFLLIDVVHFPKKLRSVFVDPDKHMPRLTTFVDTVIHYLALKSVTSAITAGCVALLLWTLDYDFIVLWAILAFLLNFIPYIGSALAAVAPVVMGLIDHGWVSALWALAGYVTINIIVGQIVETRIIGDKLNLSSFVVFVSLAFWGWILGPVGMFLSIPLTMLLLIALESNESTRRYAVLLKG